MAPAKRRPTREMRNAAIDNETHKRINDTSNDYPHNVSRRIQALDAMIENDEEEEDGVFCT